ncbi:MAG: hypothetical protein WC979_00340 [Candidatus Pacearchaeota archaeon]|jgi:hypothetical protein|nr:hypothetical protein [Clostridia bacterium]
MRETLLKVGESYYHRFYNTFVECTDIKIETRNNNATCAIINFKTAEGQNQCTLTPIQSCSEAAKTMYGNTVYHIPIHIKEIVIKDESFFHIEKRDPVIGDNVVVLHTEAQKWWNNCFGMRLAVPKSKSPFRLTGCEAGHIGKVISPTGKYAKNTRTDSSILVQFEQNYKYTGVNKEYYTSSYFIAPRTVAVLSKGNATWNDFKVSKEADDVISNFKDELFDLADVARSAVQHPDIKFRPAATINPNIGHVIKTTSKSAFHASVGDDIVKDLAKAADTVNPCSEVRIRNTVDCNCKVPPPTGQLYYMDIVYKQDEYETIKVNANKKLLML